jgi:hypothetical protein
VQAVPKLIPWPAPQSCCGGVVLQVGHMLWDAGRAAAALDQYHIAARYGCPGALLALGAVAEGAGAAHGMERDAGTALACYSLAAALGSGDGAARAARLAAALRGTGDGTGAGRQPAVQQAPGGPARDGAVRAPTRGAVLHLP